MRLAPAVITWDGGGTNNLWSNAANWHDFTGANVAPQEGDDLVFPGTGVDPTSLSSNNNIAPAVAGQPTSFSSITFTGAGYTFAGNSIDPGDAGITQNIASGSNTLNLGIRTPLADGLVVVGGGAPLQVHVAGGSLAFASLSGAGNLLKNGAGELELRGNNSGFTGDVLINVGTLTVSNAGGLGPGTGGILVPAGTLPDVGETVVAAGATLVLIGDSILTDTPLAIEHEALVLAGTLRTGAPRFGAASWGGPVALTGDAEFNVSAPLTITGVISGLSGNDLTKTGAGQLKLSGANTYSGQTTVAQGSVFVQHDTALGSSNIGTRVLSGASLQFAAIPLGSGLFFLIVAEPLQLNGSGVNGAGAVREASAAGLTNLVGPITLESATTLRVDAAASTLLSRGGISGPSTAALTKAGPGTLTLQPSTTSPANTYAGDTLVNAGTLLVNKSAPNSHFFLNGGTLAGTDSIGALTANSGVLSPGSTASTSTRGILPVQGSAQLNSTTNFRVDFQASGSTVPGTGFDQLQVQDSTVLNGANLVLNAPSNFTSVVGNRYRIIDTVNGSLTGQFAQGSSILLPTPNGNIVFDIEYVGNDVELVHQNTRSMFPGRQVTPVITEGGFATLTGRIGEPDPRDFFILDINWGDGTSETRTFSRRARRGT